MIVAPTNAAGQNPCPVCNPECGPTGAELGCPVCGGNGWIPQGERLKALQRRRQYFMWLVITLYIAAIVVANGLVTFYGQIALPFTSFALIPFDLIARDILQDRWQDRSKSDLRFRMTIVIMSGATISILTGTGSARINLASFVAFIVAGAIDAVTYQWMIRYGRIFRINGATITAAITDSLIFVLIAFDHAVWSLVVFQIIMKMTGGLCWSLLLYRFFRKPVYGCVSCECMQAPTPGSLCDVCRGEIGL